MALAEAIPSGAAMAALSGRPEVEAGSEIAWQGGSVPMVSGAADWTDSLKNAQTSGSYEPVSDREY